MAKPFLLLFILVLGFVPGLYCQQRYDIIIDEIMADPSPRVNLPANEWIELKNISSAPVNLAGWRLADASGQSGPIPSYTILPDSFLVICSSGSLTDLQPYGNTISVSSFPSLDNAGELLVLKSNSGNIIHAVRYSDTWYQNPVKSEGGWTLEMIDTKNPCAGDDNWKASTDPDGGTPGRKNSADAILPDPAAAELVNTYMLNDSTVVLEFNKPIDSLSASIETNYTIDNSAGFNEIMILPPLWNSVQLITAAKLNRQTVYELSYIGINDCPGKNSLSGKIKIGIPETAENSDLIINEILFNPKSGGSDYVELYNRSLKVIDAAKLYLASRNSSNNISSQKSVSEKPAYLYPGDYRVVTENRDRLAMDYFVKDPRAVIEVPALPSYPDDEGTVVLLNYQGNRVDELHYFDDWHFKLIQNPEGVSLERIDPEAITQNADNWHSAASSSGYGTPGYRNSQYKTFENIPAAIQVTPVVFSPDNDGYNDIATIQYRVTGAGFVANVTIFDAMGRPVKNLVQNALLSPQGYWNWDGLDNKGLKLPAGNYIILTEVFNLKGEKKQFKNTIALARRLN